MTPARTITVDVHGLTGEPTPLDAVVSMAAGSAPFTRIQAKCDEFIRESWEQIAAKAWTYHHDVGRGLIVLDGSGQGTGQLTHFRYFEAKGVPGLGLGRDGTAAVEKALAAYDPETSIVAVVVIDTVTGGHYVFRLATHLPPPPVAARAQQN